uniref:Uncharacterized protein n=1 Tax=Oryza punctata TaxID=4537 RepID=A0A0E0KY54_ORYPU
MWTDGLRWRPVTGYDLDDSPHAAAPGHHKMTMLGGLVWERGDQFFSLALSFTDPTTWMDWERAGCQALA